MRSCNDGLADLGNASSDQRQAHAGVGRERRPPLGVHFAKGRPFSDPHGELRGEFRIGDRRQKIVERRQTRAIAVVQDLEVFAVRIGVSDDQIEDHRIEQFQHINSRPGCHPAEKREAILERRATLACVFSFCRHA